MFSVKQKHVLEKRRDFFMSIVKKNILLQISTACQWNASDNWKPISDHGGSPDCISMLLMTSITPAAWENYRIPIYSEKKETGWLIHPVHKEKVDVIALEVTFPEGFDGIVNPINKIPFRNDRLEVSDDVFIIGFPLNLLGGGAFPIWKRGSVATEPDMNFEDLPKFLFVDTATRKRYSVSGSQVVVRKKVYTFMITPMTKLQLTFARKFCGYLFWSTSH